MELQSVLWKITAYLGKASFIKHSYITTGSWITEFLLWLSVFMPRSSRNINVCQLFEEDKTINCLKAAQSHSWLSLAAPEPCTGRFNTQGSAHSCKSILPARSGPSRAERPGTRESRGEREFSLLGSCYQHAV